MHPGLDGSVFESPCVLPAAEAACLINPQDLILGMVHHKKVNTDAEHFPVIC